jgi:trk/ktr system potassium uptake protein
MKGRITISPFWLPILFFALAIILGALLLQLPISLNHGTLEFIDALFTATSATCVTGLTVVDTGTRYTLFGQSVILTLIQLGGLGVMTYTGLIFYLWRRRVSLTDRVAVGQSLLHDPRFHLGRFLFQIVLWTVVIESVGALLIYVQAHRMGLFGAVFHAVSAFCNAGFALQSDSLMAWRGAWGLNLVFIALIVLGGIGFGVLMEVKTWVWALMAGRVDTVRFSWYATVVLRTTLFLILSGWIAIYLAEFVGYRRHLNVSAALLSSLFQSVTCRTAGFNTMDIGQLTNVSLFFMIVLMFIGGSAGSCAGGIKVTTFRTLSSFVFAQFSGRRQTVVGKFALDRETVNKALLLFIFATLFIVTAVLLLNISEGGDLPHPATRGLFLDILFEVVSAFGTVGLSAGLTPTLSSAGKVIIVMVMFVGRLGPILFISAIQSLQRERHYDLPEETMLIG